MLKLAYVEHEQSQKAFAHLNRETRLGLFIPFIIREGAGGRRLLQEWIINHSWCGSEKILWTSLSRTAHTRKRQGAVATPIMRELYSHALFGLQLHKAHSGDWSTLFEREPPAVYDDVRFNGTVDQVTEWIKRGSFRVWVIYNAHLLDHLALERMIESWKACETSFAVVLAARRKHGQTLEEPLENQFNRAKNGGRDDSQEDDRPSYRSPTWQELTPIEKTEFEEHVLPEILVDDLNTVFSSKVERNADLFFQSVWKYTRGHWDNIVYFATYLDDELGERKPEMQSRKITTDVVDRTFKRLLPVHYEPIPWR